MGGKPRPAVYGAWMFLVTGLLSESALSAVSPGLQLRVSQTGLDYAGSIALDKLSSNVVGKRLPDQHGTSHLKMGKVSYVLEKMLVKTFNRPMSHITVVGGEGLQWKLSGAKLSIHGGWQYKYKMGFIKVHDHGSFDLTVSGLDFTVTFILGVDTHGRPTVGTADCSCHVTSLHLNLHGGASWLYKLFRRYMEKHLTNTIQSSTCKSAKEIIKTKGSAVLSTLKVVTPVGRHMVLDYRLTEAPVLGTSYIETRHKGEIYWKTDAAKRLPFSPSAMPETTPVDRMVYIGISDYVFNSMSYAAFTHGMLQYNLTRPLSKSLHYVFHELLHESSSSISVSLKCTEMPTLKVDSAGIMVQFNGEINLYTRPDGPKLHKTHLLTATMTATANIHVTLQHNTIKASVKGFHGNVTGIYSAAGNITRRLILDVFDGVVDAFITPELNKLGDKGISLPRVDKVDYVNPVIFLRKNAIMIGTDVSFMGQSRWGSSRPLSVPVHVN